MRVLITGAGGQLGRELAHVFGAPGHHEVIAATREQLDIANRDAVLGAITSARPDAVVHAAAWTAVDACESDPDRAFQVNALGTRHVADAARRVGAQVCYVSTDYVFDGTAAQPYNEWDQPNPQSVYGKSKLGGERELNNDDLVVRTAWVFGRHGKNMVKTVLRLAATNPELNFVDDQHGKPTCADDLAAVIYQLVVGRFIGLFHVTNEGTTTWFQFARSVLAAAGEDPERVRPIPTSQIAANFPAPRPANSVLDNAALRLQGLPLLPDHREAIERIVKELQAQ